MSNACLKVPPSFCFSIFALGVRAGAYEYMGERRQPSPKIVRHQMKALYRACELVLGLDHSASGVDNVELDRAYAQVLKLFDKLIDQAPQLFDRDAMAPTAGVDAMGATDRGGLVSYRGSRTPMGAMVEVPWLVRLKDLQDIKQRRAACMLLYGRCVTGASVQPGRLRPNGRRSRSTIKVNFPVRLTRGQPKKDAERIFIWNVWRALLSAGYPLQLSTFDRYSRHPLVFLTHERLMKLGAPRKTSVVELINTFPELRSASSEMATPEPPAGVRLKFSTSNRSARTARYSENTDRCTCQGLIRNRENRSKLIVRPSKSTEVDDGRHNSQMGVFSG
jgi:hypothetical protein